MIAFIGFFLFLILAALIRLLIIEMIWKDTEIPNQRSSNQKSAGIVRRSRPSISILQLLTGLRRQIIP